MENKLKVAHIISSSNIGGSPKHTLLLCEEINALGSETLIIYPGHGSYAEQFCNSSVRTISLDKMSLSFTSYRQIKKILINENVDLIHCHELKSDFIGYCVGKSLHIPVVTTIHNMISKSRLNSLKRYIYCRISSWLYNHMSRILAVSETVKEITMRDLKVPEGLITVIPNGTRIIDKTSLPSKNSILESFKLSPNHPVIVMVGRMIPKQKGYEYFVESLPEIVEAISDIQVLIVGDGTIKSELEEKVKGLGITEKCLFTGWVSDPTPLIYASDVVVIPSLWDPLPRTLLESMMVGTPVIGTKVDGIKEVIEDHETGILIPPGNSAAIATAVIGLLTHPDLHKKISVNAEKLAREKYSSIRHAVDTMMIYKKVLNQE